MGVGDTIAFAALMIAVVAFCGMAFSAYSERLKLKAKEIELRMTELGRAAPAEAGTAARLEERVRVLERIATDKSTQLGQNLALEIEALREPVEH
ncbi:hypothetical protein [Novosphingobium sp.]|uniref:hypothetical protein n=1 Tax=Novosphingobium sp. TaxID=1874826 RepID=UPI0035B28060